MVLSELQAHRRSCPQELREISIMGLVPTQWGLRRPLAEMEARRVYIQSRGRLPKPAIIFRTPEGKLFIRDGHHDIHLAQSEGLEVLSYDQGDFIFEEWTEAEFQEVNLAAGWVTPMSLGTDFRRPELAGWKSLVFALRDHKTPAEIEAFIREHPEAYLLPKGRDLKNDPEHLGLRDEAEYLEYLRKMDQTMPMKIGQLLPAFPSKGILLDNGMGTGQQSFAYAVYNPGLLVIGQDIATEAVHHAAEKFQLPNLLFLRTDVLQSSWPDGFVDAIVESSFTHEVFSYGTPPLQLARVEKMREEAFRQLKPGGSYGMRDFVRPDWPEKVVLNLPTTARDGSAPFGNLSLAELFLDHAATHIHPEFSFEELTPSQPGFRSFVLEGGMAANFLLRINYTNETSWSSERAEQYVYSSVQENIDSFRAKGFRVDYAAPIENHWMIRNWWEKEGIEVRDLDGGVLDWPPSNFVLYATKPFPGETLSVDLASAKAVASPRWLDRRSYQSVDAPDENFDLVRVPGKTEVFLPYEQSEGEVFVWVRRNMPVYGQRYYQDLSAINTSYYQGFGAGALARVNLDEAPRRESFAESFRLKAGGHIPKHLWPWLKLNEASPYLSSPGGSDEIIVSSTIDFTGHAESTFGHLVREMKRVKFDHLLAASHLGAINDPHLELATYRIAKENKLELFPWIGPEIRPSLQDASAFPRADRLSNQSSAQESPRFVEVEKSPGFMEVRHVAFEKRTAEGGFSMTELEFVIPRSHAVDTFGVIPCINSEEGVLVGLEQRSLPSFETRGLGSDVDVIPAWRLPQHLGSTREARNYLLQRMGEDFNLKVRDLMPLGEGYFPSSGQSPEKVSLYFAELDATEVPSDLRFVPLKDLLRGVDQIADLHTRLAVFRLAHALGQF